MNGKKYMVQNHLNVHFHYDLPESLDVPMKRLVNML